MVRWRLCLAIAIMLLLPTVIGSKHNDDDDDDEDSENKEDFRVFKVSKPKFNQNNRRVEEADEEEEDEDDEDDDGGDEKNGGSNGDRSSVVIGIGQEPLIGRRAPMLMATPKSVVMSDPRVAKKRPLECFVCAYKQETPLRACVDPTKFRVHTITCHSIDDRCFTSVVSKGDNYEAIVRGCRSGCVGSAETTCCDMNRCNNKAFAMPVVEARQKEPTTFVAATPLKSKASKCFPPSIVFFVTILLILQTVGKVAFV